MGGLIPKRTTPLLVIACAAAVALSASAVGTTHPRATTCEAATNALEKAQAKLKKLKQNGAPAKAIRKAKKKVTDAQFRADAACAVIYDVTSADGTFDATYHGGDPGYVTYCTPIDKDAHWTSSLGPGAGPGTFEVYTRDRQGDPIYIFSGQPGGATGIPLISHGTGTATLTCHVPPPGDDGTTTCTFNVAPAYNDLVVSSDAEASRDPMTLDWYWGFPENPYSDPAKGGSCTGVGSHPPEIDKLESSPSLFVSSINDDKFVLEPPGVNTTSVSTFGDTATLTYSGSGSRTYEDGSTIQASWSMVVTFTRR